MYKYELIQKIEVFAPLETQEKWDCSGWLIETVRKDIKKIMLCLTVTKDVVRQAKEQNCDMIISHHPLFKIDYHSGLVSESFQPLIDVYCAHTNLDKAHGGTTDTLVNKLELGKYVIARSENDEAIQPFIRYINYETSVKDFLLKLKKISPNLRYVNNYDVRELKKIAFCAGSGSELIQEAFENGADAFVTGDLKFHTALESPIAVFDIGHFESEILILPVFEKIIGADVEFTYAEEKSPFINIDK